MITARFHSPLRRLSLTLLLGVCCALSVQAADKARVLVISIDGMSPDYVTEARSSVHCRLIVDRR